MSKRGLLDPKLDLVFKRLFAQSPDVLVDLINSVRFSEPPIVELEILNPQVTPEDITRKLVVLDILARDTSGRVLNVEMQTRQHVGLPSRMVFYLARLLGRQLEAGEEYHRVQPVIGITLMNFDLFPEAEQAVWDFELRDRQFPGIVLDRSLQLHLVEMPKAERLHSRTHQALENWVTWFRHWQEETIMQQIQHPAIQKAHQHLHTLSGDDLAWIQVIERERALSLEATFKAEAERQKAEAAARGVAEGLAEGLAKGQAEGQTALLRRQLRAKFGPLSTGTEQQLQHASSVQLERWAEQVLFADTLEQVFAQRAQSHPQSGAGDHT